ncbi:uncharacterized protein LOC101220453 [Cucumis sativus]|uniref:Uncharacterized protein n=1 Tax=Cucumis sativus TaxID=3659 RepID=A0A0A0L5Z9_CUCSA|nr:uncharacterized protein LOC101220453 [Cucumis sativus]KGN55556.1 hypothetical protein Csa_012182 [Cucumis sativus]
MGGCFSNCLIIPKVSSSVPPPPPPTAKVISLQGHLREYPVPISVSRVLQTENSSSSTSDSFLCNSDRLFYDDFIPSLPLDHQLHPNQIYFILPSSNLHHRLTAPDMAALAVKATLALQNASTNNLHLPHNKGRRRRISPLFDLDSPNDQQNEHEHEHALSTNSNSKNNTTSSSVKKLQRLTSRRAKMAVRSFKLRLSTIYEGTVL